METHIARCNQIFLILDWYGILRSGFFLLLEFDVCEAKIIAFSVFSVVFPRKINPCMSHILALCPVLCRYRVLDFSYLTKYDPLTRKDIYIYIYIFKHRRGHYSKNMIFFDQQQEMLTLNQNPVVWMVASDHARSTGIMINHAKTIHKGMLETANFLVQTRNNIGFILTPYLLYLMY